MHVMVVGPVSSADDRNSEAFGLACGILRNAGHVAHNPLDLCLEGSPYTEDIGACVAMLEECRGIALLGGWETSMGASLLVERARRLKHEEFDMEWIGEVERHAAG